MAEQVLVRLTLFNLSEIILRSLIRIKKYTIFRPKGSVSSMWTPCATINHIFLKKNIASMMCSLWTTYSLWQERIRHRKNFSTYLTPCTTTTSKLFFLLINHPNTLPDLKTALNHVLRVE